MPLEKNLVVLEDLLTSPTVVQQIRGGTPFAVTPINPQGLSKTATLLVNDYQFHTWSDTLTKGTYEVVVTIAQFGLPVGTWYVTVDRAATDTIASQNRLLTARLSTNSNVQFGTVCTNGVWTPWTSNTATATAWAQANRATVMALIATNKAANLPPNYVGKTTDLGLVADSIITSISNLGWV